MFPLTWALETKLRAVPLLSIIMVASCLFSLVWIFVFALIDPEQSKGAESRTRPTVSSPETPSSPTHNCPKHGVEHCFASREVRGVVHHSCGVSSSAKGYAGIVHWEETVQP
jgi:hypothetical protein